VTVGQTVRLELAKNVWQRSTSYSG